MPDRGWQTRLWPPILAGVAIAAVSTGLWWLLDSGQHDMLAARADLTAEQAAIRTEESIQTRVDLCAAVARGWERGLITGFDDHVVHAEHIIDQFPGVLAINWLDAEGVIRFVFPRQPNEAALGEDVTANPDAGDTWRAAQRTGAVQVTPVLTLYQGGLGFVAFIPVHGPMGITGYVAAVFRVREMIDQCLARGVSEHFTCVIRSEGRVIYDSGSDQAVDGASHREPLAMQEASVGPHRWMLAISPLPKTSPSALGLDELLIPLGVVLGFMTTVLTMRLQRHRRTILQDQRALRVSEQPFRQVFEEGPVPMHLVDGDFTLIRVNRAFAQMLGYDESELSGRPLAEVLHPDDREASMHRAQKMRDGAIEGFQVERRYVHRNGQPVWTAVRGSVVSDEHGRALYGIAIVEDIRSRHTTAEALQVVAEGVSTEVGDAFFRSLVRSLAEVTGLNFAFVATLDPNDQGRLSTIAVWADGKLAANFSFDYAGTPCDFATEQLCLHPAGVRQLFPQDALLRKKTAESYAGIPLIDSHGGMIGLLVVLDQEPLHHPDLVASLLRLFGVRAAAELERLEHDRRIIESEARFRTLVENAPEAIVVLDVDTGRFVEANRNAEELFQLTREQLRRMSPSDMSPSNQPNGMASAALAAAHIQRALDGDTSVFEWTHRRPDGQEVPCEVRLVRLPSSGQRLVRGSMTDISARLALQRRQQMMMQELDHRVKNNLAAVLSIAAQTIQASASLEEFHRTFIGRVQAMARTHEALARARWEGGDVRHLVELVMDAPRLGAPDRVRLSGPSLLLPGRAVMPLCMALHELATNAIKYGGLSDPGGHVSIDWRSDEGEFTLRWVEDGGPPVVPPTRYGTGLTLVRGFIDYELRGRSRFNFQDTGLDCVVSFRLNDDPS